MEFAVEAQKLVLLFRRECWLMLQLQNLKASVNDKLILNGLNLEIKTGEVMQLWAQMDLEKVH